jgi:acyl-CoA thioesterase-1
MVEKVLAFDDRRYNIAPMPQRKFLGLGLVLSTLLLAGCSTFKQSSTLKSISGESLVLSGTTPVKLAFGPAKKAIQVRSTYLDNLPQTVHYEAERDFTFDASAGTIQRTPHSRIPDFSTNMLFGIRDFDHSKFPGYGNAGFFVFVDYAPKKKIAWPRQSDQLKFLLMTHAKLRHGDPVRIVAFGDSITFGGDTSTTNLVFWKRWTDALQTKYPKARIEAINGATGGDRTGEGISRFQDKVLSKNPDLVLIGFGMNDNNFTNYGTSLDQFASNLKSMIDQIRAKTKAEVILYSAFPPNPNWYYGSKNMESYARVTEAVAREKGCAFADVFHNWRTFAAQKNTEDMLSNNINHPNDFGHWIYFRVLSALGL